jgi:heterodisulfide reductase subunit E
VAEIFATGYLFYALYRKWRSWSCGVKQERVNKSYWARIVRIWLAEIVVQRQLLCLSSLRWVIHMLIFGGFIGLAFLSISLAVLRRLTSLGWDGGWADFFLRNEGYILIKLWGNGFGLALLLGLALACVRRFFPGAPPQKNEQRDWLLLLFLLWLTLSGFALEGLRVSLVSPDVSRYSFIGRLFTPPGVFTLRQLLPWLTLLWTLHSFSGLALLVYFPHSKLLHSILAPLIIAQNAVEEQERRDLYWPKIPRQKATRSPGG